MKKRHKKKNWQQTLCESYFHCILTPLNFPKRLLTGSFDKSLKIWSIDGKLIHKLDTFLSTVSGICYVPRNKTIWAAGGTFYASMFDPKSGDNVSIFSLLSVILKDSVSSYFSVCLYIICNE